MSVSQKCQYALRALHELARHEGHAPLKIGAIAARQAIPARFLEAILNELKGAGLVQSRRGNEGGYLLARPAHAIRVGEVVRALEGPLRPVPRGAARAEGAAFEALWDRAEAALSAVYDRTSLADLVAEERARASVHEYAI